MGASWIIAKKELASFFDSLVAYVILFIFLSLCGTFTWLLGSDIFFRNQADLQVFFTWASWIFLFFIPAITMKQLAEEKRSGTIELLLTKDVSVRKIIAGKFIACLLMVLIALAFTLPYYFSVSMLGEMDHGATITGYLGLFLMSAGYIAIGLFASSITDNQIIAFLIAVTICILFHFVFGFIASSFGGWFGTLLDTLSMQTHYHSISRGVIDSKDLIYFFIDCAGIGSSRTKHCKALI